MFTFHFNFLFKTAYFQLRLPSLPLREPDPSQKCKHVLSILSSKLLIFNSGCHLSLPQATPTSLPGHRIIATPQAMLRFPVPEINPPIRKHRKLIRRPHKHVNYDKKESADPTESNPPGEGQRPGTTKRTLGRSLDREQSYGPIPSKEFHSVPDSSDRKTTIVSSDLALGILYSPQ